MNFQKVSPKLNTPSGIPLTETSLKRPRFPNKHALLCVALLYLVLVRNVRNSRKLINKDSLDYKEIVSLLGKMFCCCLLTLL